MNIREATIDDNRELQRLQAECPQGTTIIASTVNTPDFFARAKAYEWSRVFVVCEDDRIIGSGSCAIREAVVNGRMNRVGYGFQFFVSSDYRRKGLARKIIRKVERYLTKHGATLFYCLILEGNAPSMRLFEQEGFDRHRSLVMPGIAVYKVMEVSSKGKVRTVDFGDLSGVATLLNNTWHGFELYKPTSADELALFIARTPGYGSDSLIVLEYQGEILACLGFWDWSQITRVTVKTLSLKMRMIGLVLNIGRVFRPLPQFLKPGQTLKQMVLTPIGFKDPAYLEVLVRCLNNKALSMGVEQIFCVCERDHELLTSMKGFIRVDTAMHLYIKPLVDDLTIGDGPVYLDGIDL